MKFLPVIFVAGAAAADPGPINPLFTDQSGGLPIQHSYTGDWEHFVGGGVAVFDCNGDALPELFAAGGENPARLFLNASTPGGDLQYALGEVPERLGGKVIEAKNGTIVHIEGAGHNVRRDQKDSLLKSLKAFLAQL